MKTAKQLVIETVGQMSEAASFDEIRAEIAILAQIRRGQKAADEGCTVPHEAMKGLFASWIAKG